MPQQPPKSVWVDDDPNWVDDTEKPSFGKQVWDTVANTPEFIMKPVRQFGDFITEPRMADMPTGKDPIQDAFKRFNIANKGFAAGAIEGMAGFLNPLDVAGMATGVGEYNAARRGLEGVAKALKWGERATSAPIAIHGAQTIVDPNTSMGQKGLGLAELAGGTVGTISRATPVKGAGKPPSSPALEREMPIRPEVNPSVAGAVRGANEAGSVGIEDININKPLTNYDSVDKVIAAYESGELNQKSAMAILEKYHKQEMAPTVKPTVTKPSSVNSPNVTEIIDLMKSGRVKNVAELQRELGISYNQTKVLWTRAKDTIRESEMQPGFFDHMPPEEPRDVMTPAPRGQTFIIRKTDASKDIMSKAREMGYKFAGLTDKGDYKFKQIEPESTGGPTLIKPLSERINSETGAMNISRGRELLNAEKAKQESKPTSGVGRVFRDGNVEFTDTEGRNPNFTPHNEDGPWFADKFRYRNGEVIWNDTPSTESVMSVEDYLYSEGKKVTGHKKWDGSPIKSFTERLKSERGVMNIEGEGFPKPGTGPRSFDPGEFGTEKGWMDEMTRRAKAKEPWNIKIKQPEPPEDEFTNLFDGLNIRRVLDESTGKVGTGVNAKRVVELMKNSFTGDRFSTAAKELIQNAGDSHMPDGITSITKKPIKVTISDFDNSITVQDNGAGFNREIYIKAFTDIGETGKDASVTIGGAGVGKTTYMLLSEKSEITSTRKLLKDEVIQLGPNKVPTLVKKGNKIQLAANGRPEDYVAINVDFTETIVDKNTDTGTTVKAFFEPDDYSSWRVQERLNKMFKYGKVPFKINFLEAGENYRNSVSRGILTEKELQETWSTKFDESRFNADTTVIHSEEVPGGKYTLREPNKVQRRDADSISVHLNVRGMYQATDTIRLNELAELPTELTLDIEPTVPAEHPHYPLTIPVREQLKGPLKNAVQKFIEDKYLQEGRQKRGARLDELFKNLGPKPGKKYGFIDYNSRLTPEEITKFEDSPTLSVVHDHITAALTELKRVYPGWNQEIVNIGFIFEKGTRGISVQNPAKETEFSLFFNLPALVNESKDLEQVGDVVAHVILHEYTHNFERGGSYDSHGKNFVALMASIDRQWGNRSKLITSDAIVNSLGGKAGIDVSRTKLHSDIEELIRITNEAEGRPEGARNVIVAQGGSKISSEGGTGRTSKGAEPSGKGTLGNIKLGATIIVKSEQATPANVKRLYNEGFRFVGENDQGGLRFKKTSESVEAPILEEEVGSHRPTTRGIQGQLGAVQNAQKSSAIMEAFNFPRGVMASTDLSAPLRQGLPLIHKKAFWTSFKPMMESWATEDGFQASQASIAERPLFKKRVGPMGETLPSFADDAGLKLTDLTDLNNREEALMSTWAESGGMFNRNKWMAEHGGNVAAKVYSSTMGAMVRKSNRAYTAFLNHLRADTFEALIRDGRVLADIKNNLPLARELADFVNTATGRGSLGKLEKSASVLNTGLFAPRLIASRVKILNPHYYIMATPQVRKEALKSLFAVAAFGNTVLQLAKMGGELTGTDVSVETDPASSDFGKAKIGNIRIDPWAGFQQYIVAANRLIRPNFAKVPGMEGGTDSGIVPLDLATGFAGGGGWRTKSSTTGKEYDLLNPQGPYGQTPADVAGRFARGKMNPILGFAWSMATGGKEMSGQPMNFRTMNPMENAITQRFIPIFVQDVYQLANEDPRLLPLAIPAGLGMGVQNYSAVK